ncbi:MAG: hypothetical protein JSV88_30915 [Candidatus Aminicenantes bacterium]|nr:MAG: hypothetical protein JSV88_30915 [Candidatus Aminicenantes bacterium]
MKKKVIFMGIMLLVGSIFFASSPLDRQDLYIKAVSETDPQMKIQLLKQYEGLYGQQQDHYIKFIYIQLAETLFQVKNYHEAITYGEKALEFAEIPATNKLNLLYALANSYQASQKDLQKAYDYADSMIELTNWVIDKAKNSDLEKEKIEEFVKTYKAYYIASGYRIQAMTLFSRDKENLETIKESAQKAVAAYMEDKSENSSRLLFSLVGQLYKNNKLDDAIAIVGKVFDETNPNSRFASFLGASYYKKGDKDKAVYYFELAYKTNRDIKTAMNIGRLVHKKDIDKGIQYFADAFILSSLDENSKAFEYLRDLYYNHKAKNLPSREQDKGFKEIIEAAKVRVGVEVTEDTAATTTN